MSKGGVRGTYGSLVGRRQRRQTHQFAQSNLGRMFDMGKGVSRNYKEAVRLYRLSAKQGSKIARNNLRNIIKTMKNVKNNKQNSKRLFRVASKTLRKSRTKK